MMRSLIAALSLVSLVACSSTKDVPVAELYTKPALVLPEVPPVAYDPVELKATMAPDGTVWFMITPEGLNAIHKNEKSVRDHIIKEKSVIDAYKEYYKDGDAPNHK